MSRHKKTPAELRHEIAQMVRWDGGAKPADWSGEPVQFRNGEIMRAPPAGTVWKLGWDHSYGAGDIIAYTPKPSTGATADKHHADDLTDEHTSKPQKSDVSDVQIAIGVEQQDWAVNVEELLSNYPGTIRARPGGGPKDLLLSLILTFNRMKHDLATLSPPSVIDPAGEATAKAIALVRRIAAREPWQKHYGHSWEDEAAAIVASLQPHSGEKG